MVLSSAWTQSNQLEQGLQRTFFVKPVWDDEARVYVSQSDIAGLQNGRLILVPRNLQEPSHGERHF